MSKNQTGDKNGMWKGGRVVASNGYILIRVGTNHHLADCRGYAYEHRLVAEEKLGRRLEDGEIVHHIDENKQNNNPENLEVVRNAAEHFLHHRKSDNLRIPGEPNPTIECGCGCGTKLFKYDTSGRPRQYQSGHNPQPSPIEREIVEQLSTHGILKTNELVGNVNGHKASVLRAARRLIKQGVVTKKTRGFYSLTRKDMSHG